MFLYNLLISLVQWGIEHLPLRSPKWKLFREGQRDVFPLLERKIDEKSLYIWVHVSSLGEFEQGRLLIENIKNEYPSYKVLLTFFSPSGYELRKDYEKADIVSYLPLDTKANVLRFISLVKPIKAIFVKYDFWPNYLTELQKRGVPTFLISAVFKKRQAFFKWYGKGYRKLLNCFTHIFVQDRESKELIDWISFSRISICGDTRIDSVIDAKEHAKEFPLVKSFAENAKKTEKHTIIMGSSWEKEEEFMAKFVRGREDIQLIIAPHDISEKHLKEIEERFSSVPLIRYSQAKEEEIERYKILLIDCIGMLSYLYRYGEVAIIGGGFRGNIHNILEPAVYGLPILFGPDHRNFPEAVELVQTGGAFCFYDSKGLFELLNPLLDNVSLYRQSSLASMAYINSHSGGTKKIIQMMRL